MTTSWLNIWNPVLINRSNRPILQENEYNIYIRDNVGLYQGRQKIINHQNGRVYLTNKRLIYFDNNDSSRSIAVELKLFKNAELVADISEDHQKSLYILKPKIRILQISVAMTVVPILKILQLIGFVKYVHLIIT